MYEAEALELMAGVAASLGMSAEDGEIVARHLVDDELHGAVGMSRIFIVADEVARHGPQRTEPITVARESDITAVVDGGGHHGLVVAESATRLAIAKAQKSGIAIVCARSHWYSGTLGYYIELVARNEMVGISVASGSFGSVAGCCAGIRRDGPPKPRAWLRGAGAIGRADDSPRVHERLGSRRRP
jgi:LDH2 family malate/lactate/ureidoglycolate dehydrogenase